jgi:hypothetical protein
MKLKYIILISIVWVACGLNSFAGTFTDQTNSIFLGTKPELLESAASWGDFNNDGYWDLIVCGKDSGGNPKTYLYENVDSSGRKLQLKSANLINVWRGDVEWFDYDNDGDLDLIIAGDTGVSSPQTKIYENDGSGSFSDSGISLSNSYACDIALGDYNNDGKLDIAIAGEPYIGKIYKNTGGDFTDSGISMYASNDGELEWADLNNNGWLDLIQIGQDPTISSGSIRTLGNIYKNTRGSLSKYREFDTKEAFRGAVQIADYDNDGDLDIAMIGGLSIFNDKEVMGKIYENIGSFNFSTHTFTPEASYGSLAWGDVDNNGELDLAIQGAYKDNSDKYNYHINLLDPSNSYTVNTATLSYAQTAPNPAFFPTDGSVIFADYDGDKDLDIFICGQDSSQNPIGKLYQNDESISGSPNNVPPKVTSFGSRYYNGKLYMGWNDPPIADTETATSGLYYNFRVGTKNGESDLVPSRYGSPLLGNYITKVTSTTIDDPDVISGAVDVSQYKHVRVMAVTGKNYYWAVQTIDTSLGYTWASSYGDGWSEQQVFIDSTVPMGLPSTPVDEGIATYNKDLTFTLSKGSAQDNETGIYGCYLQIKAVDDYGTETTVVDTEISDQLKDIIWDTDGVATYEYSGQLYKTYYARIKARHGYSQSIPTGTYKPYGDGSRQYPLIGDGYGDASDPDGLWVSGSPHYTAWSSWSDGIKIAKLLNVDNNIMRQPGSVADAVDIGYMLTKDGNVTIRIFNALGELVKTILDEYIVLGSEQTQKWFGKTEGGENVASGMYYVNVQASGSEDTQKVIVVK